MKGVLTPAMMRRLALRTPEERARLLAEMGPAELLRFDAWFEAWADPGQLPPDGEGWRTWLLMAGRGFGKTRAGAEWVHQLAMPRRGTRIALVGATIAEAQAVMVEGRSGLIAAARSHGVRLKWEPSRGRLTWPGGTVAELFSGDSPEGLRGPEHHYCWADELAKWRRPREAWDNLQMGLRAGRRPRALVTTTPKPLRLLSEIEGDRRTICTGGPTERNLSLPKQFLAIMRESYGGTRLGRQELDGELLTEAEGSLFPRALIEAARSERPPTFDRIVVGVDPPAGAGANSDACGIVVAGQWEKRAYVLADLSVQGLRPEGWARAVAAAAEEWGADRVIAEGNQGGAMVEAVLKAADVHLPVRMVHARRGKSARAEPMAVRFESGTAFFAGRFDALEDELAGLMAGGGYDGPGRSPDRADAMIWALWALTETQSGLPRISRL